MTFYVEDLNKMTQDTTIFNNKFIVLGFGSLGPSVVSLLQSNFPNNKVVIITDINTTPQSSRDSIQHLPNVEQVVDISLTHVNYVDVLNRVASTGDFMINLTVDVSCYDLITWCQLYNVLYIDTALYQWADNYDAEPPTNWALRQKVLSMTQASSTTAIIAHGANPGLVNHFVKSCIDKLYYNQFGNLNELSWSSKAQAIGLKTIHISEVDTQWSSEIQPAPGDFVNTWSVQGFINEALMPSELTLGSHEKNVPDIFSAARSDHSARSINAGIYTRVKGWNPYSGQYLGFMITHNEAISLGQFLSDNNSGYWPSVYYVYRPTSATIAGLHDWVGNDYSITGDRVLLNEHTITAGKDYLGVLLMGNFGAVWCGNILSAEHASRTAKFANATTLQVTAPLLAAIEWAIHNPSKGIVEAEDIDHNFIVSRVESIIGTTEYIEVDWELLKCNEPTLENFIVR